MVTYDAGATVELGKAQESSDSVVVYMKESYGINENARARTQSAEIVAGSTPRVGRTKRFLLQHEENGIEELEVLEIVVDNIIELQPLYATNRRARYFVSMQIHFGDN